MTKSRLRKGRKNRYVDASGKPITKKSAGRIRNAMLMRTFKLQDACRSLSASEVGDVLEKLKIRRESEEKIKPPKPALKYVETRLDENQVPVAGETKEIIVSNADIDRLSAIFKAKTAEEDKAKKEQEELTNKNKE